MPFTLDHGVLTPQEGEAGEVVALALDTDREHDGNIRIPHSALGAPLPMMFSTLPSLKGH
jgi:hypothetical protein